MAHNAGSALYAEYVHGGGTVVLTGDQRSFSWDQMQDFAEISAGSDDGRSWVKTLSHATGSFDWVDNDAATFGTIVYDGVWVIED